MILEQSNNKHFRTKKNINFILITFFRDIFRLFYDGVHYYILIYNSTLLYFEINIYNSLF